MSLGSVARLFVNQALWRGLALRGAGRALVSALGSGDEDLGIMAGIFLVKSGRKATPLLRDAIARREHLPILLRIVGVIGARELTPELERFTTDRDRAVAQAARDALRALGAP